VAAAETNSSSGAELGCRLITGSVWPGMKTSVLHFKKELLNIPEILYLHNISSVQLRQKKIQTHKCIVAKMASEECCTEIKDTVTNLMREA
jgi:hypothetical protein